MVVLVNGEPQELSGAPTVAALLATLTAAPDGRGVAVAIDGEVVPRGQWGTTALIDGARVEVVVAVQGG
jgi:sulfur carrier protein